MVAAFHERAVASAQRSGALQPDLVTTLGALPFGIEGDHRDYTTQWIEGLCIAGLSS